MAGESAREQHDRLRAHRRDRVRRSLGRCLTLIVVAFGVGWVLPILMYSAMLSVARSAGTDAASFTVATPPIIVSAIFAVSLAGKTAIALLRPSQAEIAWRKGAEGEEVVGRALDALGGAGIRALHDRRMPGSRANLDHVAIGPTGVLTIDAKHYAGRLEVRRRRQELWIKGNDRSKLLAQAKRQADVVRAVLAQAGLTGVPVHPALCFVGTKVPLLSPRQAGGVLLATPRQLRARLLPRADAHLDAAKVVAVTEILNAALEPYVQAPERPVSTAHHAGTAFHRPQPARRAAPMPKDPATTVDQPPSCSCGAVMVPRTRRQDGQRFYGCPTYPRCRNTQPITPP